MIGRWLMRVLEGIPPGMTREIEEQTGMLYDLDCAEEEGSTDRLRAEALRPRDAEHDRAMALHDRANYIVAFVRSDGCFMSGARVGPEECRGCFVHAEGVRAVRVDERTAYAVVSRVDVLDPTGHERPRGVASVETALARKVELALATGRAMDAAVSAGRAFAPLAFYDDCVIPANQASVLETELAQRLATVPEEQTPHEIIEQALAAPKQPAPRTRDGSPYDGIDPLSWTQAHHQSPGKRGGRYFKGADPLSWLYPGN